MVRHPECRARYLSEIALLGSVVLPRIRDDEAYSSFPYQPPKAGRVPCQERMCDEQQSLPPGVAGRIP